MIERATTETGYKPSREHKVAENHPTGRISWHVGWANPFAFGWSEEEAAYFAKCEEGSDGIPMQK